MGKKTTETNGLGTLLSGHRSYSINEIMAAGGAVAFANKLGKRPETVQARFKDLPNDAFLTDEELKLALKTLSESK